MNKTKIGVEYKNKQGEDSLITRVFEAIDENLLAKNYMNPADPTVITATTPNEKAIYNRMLNNAKMIAMLAAQGIGQQFIMEGRVNVQAFWHEEII